MFANVHKPVHGLRLQQRSGTDRPGAVSADVMDRRPRPLRGRRCPGRGRVRDETPARDRHAGPRWRAGLIDGSAWATADEAYGQNPTFRAWLADHEVPFVLATRNDDVLTSPDGHRRQAKVLATIAGARGAEGGDGWERRSIGPGAHEARIYDWTIVALDTTVPRACGGDPFLIDARHGSG